MFRKLTLLIPIFVFISLISCEEGNDTSNPIDFKEIRSQFPVSTQFKSVAVLPKKISVITTELNDFRHFKEYEFQNGKWKNTSTYESEIMGNANEVDFLFSLNDSLVHFVNHKKDSLSKDMKIEGLRISTQNSFYQNNPIQITFLVNQNLRDKKLYFSY